MVGVEGIWKINYEVRSSVMPHCGGTMVFEGKNIRGGADDGGRLGKSSKSGNCDLIGVRRMMVRNLDVV